MFKEYKNLRQEPDSYRRMFYDENFDLYIWYPSKEDAKIIGFQLVYNMRFKQKALTWREECGFDHTQIDEGDKGINKSPVLVNDGLFDYALVHENFLKSMTTVDADISEFILERYTEFASTLHATSPSSR